MSARHAAAVLTLAAALALPGLAAATGIEEILAGAFGRPEIQFVELEVDCQSVSWDSAYLTFLDAEDRLLAEFHFPSAPTPCNGTQPVLVGTQAFADLASAPDPDFLMPPLLAPGSGKVCFGGCTSYGSFEGDLLHGSVPFNAPPLPAEHVCALQRVDDTRTNADFDLLPPSPVNARRQTGTVAVPPRFLDVPAASPFQVFVEALFNAGVTGGCGGGNFCPGSAVTREQMAVFLLLAAEGKDFRPPACETPVFGDVPCSNPFAAWIDELAARGVSGGCGGGNFCPGSAVTREQMAVFLLLGREGPGFQPPACSAPAFADVPCASPFAPWINELAARGVTGGCGDGAFCPGNAVTREQMAVFLSTVFELPVPARGCPAGPADDHGDTPATATPVVPSPAAPGTLVQGVLERPRDREVFSFPAQVGERFHLTLVSGPDLTWRSLDCATGQILREASQDSLVLPADRPGSFCLEVQGASGTDVGPYAFLLRGPLQDLPAPGTPLVIDGPTVAGEWELPGDSDTFTLTTTGPQALRVELTASSGSDLVVDGSTLGDDVALFFAPSAQTLVVEAEGGSGAYSLRARSVPDAPGHGVGTATLLQSGVPVSGTLGHAQPAVFRFEADADDPVSLHVGHGGDARARLFRLAGGAEVQIAQPSGNVREVTAFVASEPGPYFLRLDGVTGDSASYQILLVNPVPPDDHGDDAAGATPLAVSGQEALGVIGPFGGDVGDVDVFSFSGQAGNLFELSFTGSQPFFRGRLTVVDANGATVIPIGAPLSDPTRPFLFHATSSSPYFASVSGSAAGDSGAYRIAVRAQDPQNERGSVPSSAAPLVPGTPPVTARVDYVGDVDRYSFTATQGELILVKMVWPQDEFFEPDLQILDEAGIAVFTSSFPRITSRGAFQAFQAPGTGTFLIKAWNRFGQRHEYSLSVSSPIGDDHNVWLPPTPLAVDGAAVEGEVTFWGDADVFGVDLSAGQRVIVEVTPLEEGHDTEAAILAPNGFEVASDDDGGGSFAPRLDFTAPSAGRYLVRIRTSFFAAGHERYRVAVRSHGP